MIVTKVRGKNEIKPILLLPSEVALMRRLGLDIPETVTFMVRRIAKQRRWKWYFERSTQKGKLKS